VWGGMLHDRGLQVGVEMECMSDSQSDITKDFSESHEVRLPVPLN